LLAQGVEPLALRRGEAMLHGGERRFGLSGTIGAAVNCSRQDG
jgi:hypothetical protein